MYCFKNYKNLIIKNKKLLWKINLDLSSVFSSPICDQFDSVYTSTLGGNLFKVNKQNGQVIAQFELDKATFTSPVVNLNTQRIFLGTCGGTFYCLDFEISLVN